MDRPRRQRGPILSATALSAAVEAAAKSLDGHPVEVVYVVVDQEWMADGTMEPPARQPVSKLAVEAAAPLLQAAALRDAAALIVCDCHHCALQRSMVRSRAYWIERGEHLWHRP